MARILTAVRFASAMLLLAALGCEDPASTDWVASPPSEFSDVSAGAEHTCALDTDGRAFCWGRDMMARLGYTSRTDPCNGSACYRPVPVTTQARFDDVESGGAHNCASSGPQLLCWGWAWWGQLGDARTAAQRCPSPEGQAPLPCSLDPLPVALGFPVVAFTTGGNHSCVVTGDGDAYCFGLNQFGQTGALSALDTVITPTIVTGAHRFESISAGPSHTCAVDAESAAWCWGANDAGRLGDSTMVDSEIPILVAGGLRWLKVDAGEAHTCGITTAGEAYCWGSGGNGRLGDGLGLTWTYPVPVYFQDSTTTVVDISAGATHSCAITASSELYCFGENGFGQLGDASGVAQIYPSLVVHPEPFVQVSAGDRHTCAINSLQHLYCWGSDQWGQLGLGAGSTTDYPLPRRVGG